MVLKQVTYFITIDLNGSIENLDEINKLLSSEFIEPEAKINFNEGLISVDLLSRKNEKFFNIYKEGIFLKVNNSKYLQDYRKTIDSIVKVLRTTNDGTGKIKSMEMESYGILNYDGEDMIDCFKNQKACNSNNFRIDYRGFVLYSVYKQRPYVVNLDPVFDDKYSVNFDVLTKLFSDNTDISFDMFNDFSFFVENELDSEIYKYLTSKE